MERNGKYNEQPTHLALDSFQIDSRISIANLIER